MSKLNLEEMKKDLETELKSPEWDTKENWLAVSIGYSKMYQGKTLSIAAQTKIDSRLGFEFGVVINEEGKTFIDQFNNITDIGCAHTSYLTWKLLSKSLERIMYVYEKTKSILNYYSKISGSSL